MFSKVTTAAVLISGVAFSGVASANEVSLEEFVGNMITHAVNVTKEELQNNVTEAVLTANHVLGFEESEAYATKVTISEFGADEESNDKAE